MIPSAQQFQLIDSASRVPYQEEVDEAVCEERKRGPCNMEDAAMSGMKIGEFCSSDIQVAITEGNRQRHSFFAIKMGKMGVAMPFQQGIPSDFTKYHPKLHLEDITLEGPCGRSWGVTIRPLCNVMRFGKGWRQFSVENHLREGYQLLFYLVGKSRFVVHFFDNSGKGHAGFSPLTSPVPAFAEPSFPSQRDEEDTREPTPPFQTPIAKPPQKPATPQAKPPALDSDNAKVILRQFFTQVHSNLSANMGNSSATVLTEDKKEHKFTATRVDNSRGIKTEPVGNQGRYEEQAPEDGKVYIILDSDESDDELGKQELFVRTPSKRGFFEENDNKLDAGDRLSLGEQTGFHSPRTPRLASNTIHMKPEKRVKYVDQDHSEDDHYTESKTCSDYTPSKRHKSVWKKPTVKRASWEGDRDGHGHHGSSRDHYKEKSSTRNYGFRQGVRDLPSTRGDVQRTSPVERYSMVSTLSPAKILLTHQGCKNYSEIISKRKRGYVSDEERQQPLTAATRFAAGLKNESFLVVLKDYQVYHEFHLPIPRDFLEATGTLKADKVKVCLIDSQKTCYEMKWKWHSKCQTPLLNCDKWALFALDHMLDEGDVCVFELTSTNLSSLLMSVHIFNIVENSTGENSSIHCGQKFGRQAPEVTNAELRHKKRPVIDLDRPSSVQKPFNLQAWTKLFKPRVKDHFRGSRDQRQF